MNTFLSRANAIFAFTLSILAALTIICAFSTAFKNYSEIVPIQLTTNKLVVKNVADYSADRQMHDLGFVTFNLEADFENAFDWNTKQLFLYLTASYQTKANVVNQVILWDHIIERGDKTKFSLKKHHTKYYFWDDGNGLRGNNNVTLTLSMNIVPNAGFLPIATSPLSHTFSFPNEYASTNTKAK